jgi:uncharacterized protein (TIGR02996 family)
MSDHDAILAAIIADPADDLPRLAYADWCEENGDDARAEFIRVQVALAKLDAELMDEEDCGSSGCEGCKERRGLRAREAELRRGMYSMGSYGTFRRGFLAKWKGPLDAWLEHGQALAAAHPLERVEASDKRPDHEEDNRWRWYIGTSDYPDCVPRAIFELMDGFVNDPAQDQDKAYLARDAAVDALSAALIAHARNRAPARA